VPEARTYYMWEYSGTKDPSRVLQEELSSNELGKALRTLTYLMANDEIPDMPPVVLFWGDNKLPEVCLSASVNLDCSLALIKCGII
jgi:hypothetical protein